MNARRGVAMLLVVMTSTVLVVGVAILARTRTTLALTHRQTAASIRIQYLLLGSERPIFEWLGERARDVVVGPGTGAPVVGVLDEEFEIDGQRVRIRITAWDQQGMWPGNSDQLGLDPPEPRHGSADRVFPTSTQPDSTKGVLATHNPWPTRSGRTRSAAIPAININTAPGMLLEQLRAGYPTGDLDTLLEQRQTGARVTVSQTLRTPDGREVRLTGTSRVWSFRTQVSVNKTTLGMWSVYTNQGGQWRLAQRMMIDEPAEE